MRARTHSCQCARTHSRHRAPMQAHTFPSPCARTHTRFPSTVRPGPRTQPRHRPRTHLCHRAPMHVRTHSGIAYPFPASRTHAWNTHSGLLVCTHTNALPAPCAHIRTRTFGHMRSTLPSGRLTLLSWGAGDQRWTSLLLPCSRVRAPRGRKDPLFAASTESYKFILEMQSQASLGT